MSVFKNLQTGDVIIGRTEQVSEGIFPAGAFEWSNFSLDSFQTVTTGSSVLDPKSGLYYYNVFTADPSVHTDAELIFSVSYGSFDSTGSSDLDRTKFKIFPTKAIYSQYKNTILTPSDDLFTFSSGSGKFADLVDAKDIYVLNFSSEAMRERVDEGLLEFSLSGSNGIFTFVDDSPTQSSKQSVYNIVLGSIMTDTENGVVGPPIGIGLFYPSLGVVVLNAQKVAEMVGPELIPVDGTTTFALNHRKFFDAIQFGSQDVPFKGRSSELVPSRQFFIRVRNNEFNYSNNPTFVLDSTETNNPSDDGKIIYPAFYSDPHAYITTIGLYNENNELIAVAKLSQPLEKTFDSEALIKIKLDI